MKTTYCLYDLVRIDVDAGVPGAVRDAISFQIGHFQTTPCKDVPYQINIHPYEELRVPVSASLDIYYDIRGIQGRFAVDAANRIAIEKHDRGYTIWAQTGNFLITHFVQVMLQYQGIAFVHSAAVADSSGNALLIAGAGGIGKTGLIGRLVRSHSYSILGDDIVALSDKGECLAFPRPFIIKDYHESVYPEICVKYRRSRTQEAIMTVKTFIRLNAPFRDIIRKVLIKRNLREQVMKSWHSAPYLASVPITEIFGAASICERAVTKRLVFMQKYSGPEFRLESLAIDTLADKLFSIISFEWATSHGNTILLSMYDMDNLPESMLRIRNIIKSSIAESSNHILYIPERSSFSEIADYFEKYCLDA